MLEQIQCIQDNRREFVRVEESLPVECLILELQTQKIHTIQCKTLNISAGGLSLVFRKDQPILSGNIIGVSFQLNLGYQCFNIVTKGEVLRVEPYPHSTIQKMCSLKFLEVSEVTQQLLIQYVFQCEIEARKRSLYVESLIT